MRKIIILLIILTSVSYLFASFETTLYKTALEVATRPNELFVEINTDVENTTLVPFNKHFQFSTSLLMNLGTIINGQIKYKVVKESKYVPEITPGFSYWNLLALHLLPKDEFESSASGYTPFLTLGKSLDKDVKIFGGAKLSMGSVNFKLKNIEKSTNGISLDLTSIADFNAPYRELGFFTGINYIRVSGNEVSALIGYYPVMKKIYSKIQVATRTFDYGISLYPDSYLLLHIYWNLHINL